MLPVRLCRVETFLFSWEDQIQLCMVCRLWTRSLVFSAASEGVNCVHDDDSTIINIQGVANVIPNSPSETDTFFYV